MNPGTGAGDPGTGLGDQKGREIESKKKWNGRRRERRGRER